MPQRKSSRLSTLDKPGREGDLPSRLLSSEILAEHFKQLCLIDPRFLPLADLCLPLEPRRAEPGFEGLARIVVGQMVSTASAAAIWGRVRAFVDPFTPAHFLSLDPEAIRACGLTRGKLACLLGAAQALSTGALRLDEVEAQDAEHAITSLCALKGIGRWTAEVYLLFAAGHPDVFPCGDLALQKAVCWAFGLDARPDAAALSTMATAWSPYRGVAATALWRYYAIKTQSQGAPI